MEYLSNAGSYLSQILLGFAFYVVLLRFWMQWVRADFRNPFGQFVIIVTNPVVIPLRKIVPNIGVVDTSTVLLAYLIAFIKIVVLLTIYGKSIPWTGTAIFAVGEVIRYSVHIFFAAIFIQIIASWINPHGYHPILSVARSISEPLLAPARRLIPPIGGLDLSPILILVFLQLTLLLIVAPLQGF